MTSKHSRMLGRVAFVVFFSVCTFGGCDCQPPLVDPPLYDCEVPEPTFAPLDACIDGVVLAPTLQMTRLRGAPNEASISLELPGPGELCILVESDRVASATLALDGRTIIAPSAFRPQVRSIERRVPASGSEALLSVRLASMPGSALAVDVRFAPSAPSAREVAAAHDLAALDRTLCAEANLELDRFRDPADAERFVEGLAQAGIPLARVAVSRNAYGLPTYLGPLPREDLGVGADPAVIAEAWLTRHADLVGIDPAVTFAIRRVTPDGAGGARVALDEEIDGLPVFGASIGVNVDSEGSVRRMLGHLVPDRAVGIDPALNPEDAATAATAAALELALGVALETTLGIFDQVPSTGDTGLALSWRVRFDDGTVFVDARSGAILETSRAEASYHEGGAPADLDIHVVEITSGIRGEIGSAQNELVGLPVSQVRATTRVPRVGNPLYAAVGRCDERCLRAVILLGAVDFLYRTVWHRDGWSDGWGPTDPTIPGLVAPDEYSLRFGYQPRDVTMISGGGGSEQPAIAKLCYPAHGDCLADNSYVRVHDDFLTLDVLAHEFGGHGFSAHPDIRVDLDRRQDFQAEHIGDVIAMLTNQAVGAPFADDRPFAMDSLLPGEPAARDHSILECNGYADIGRCDREIATLPNQPFSSVLGCNEYVHMNYLGNFNLNSDVHLNSCIYSRIAFLLMQQDTTFIEHHGLRVRGQLSQEFTLGFFKVLFSDHSTPATNQFWEYSNRYADAVLQMIAKCGSTPAAAPECAEASTVTGATAGLANDLMAPLWAQGFWAPEIRTGTVSRAVPAAVVGPGGVHLFHTHPVTREVLLTVIANPAGGFARSTLRLSVDLGFPLVADFVAADMGTDGVLRVAFATRGGRVTLLRRGTTGTWTSQPLDVTAKDGLAVAFAEGMELVVFVSASDEIGFIDATTVRVGRIAGPARLPGLTRVTTGMTTRWLLMYAAAGPMGRPDVVQVRNLEGFGFSAAEPLMVLGPPAVPTSPRMGTDFTLDQPRVAFEIARDALSLTATTFPTMDGDRLQVFGYWTRADAFGRPDGLRRTSFVSIPVTADDTGVTLDAMRATRPVLLAQDYSGGATTIRFHDARRGDLLVIYGRGATLGVSPDDVRSTYKRSD